MPTNIIPVADAATMTALLRAEKENVLDPANRNTGLIPICETFDRSAFDTMLNDKNCVKVRIYTAMDPNLKIRFVITGVNAKDEDIFIEETSQSDVDVPSVIEVGVRCPDFCPPDSPLNS